MTTNKQKCFSIRYLAATKLLQSDETNRPTTQWLNVKCNIDLLRSERLWQPKNMKSMQIISIIKKMDRNYYGMERGRW